MLHATPATHINEQQQQQHRRCQHQRQQHQAAAAAVGAAAASPALATLQFECYYYAIFNAFYIHAQQAAAAARRIDVGIAAGCAVGVAALWATFFYALLRLANVFEYPATGQCGRVCRELSLGLK